MSKVTVIRSIPATPRILSITLELTEQEAGDLKLLFSHIGGTALPYVSGDPYAGSIRETTTRISTQFSVNGVWASDESRLIGMQFPATRRS